MDTGTIIAIAIVVGLALLALAGFMWLSRRHESQPLRQRFGPEYDDTISAAEDRRRAERELAGRERRVEKLHIKDLSHIQQQRYQEEWRRTQARFLDDPSATVREADQIVQRLMDARGYPIAGFDQQAADISVDHPEVVRYYREAHAIALRHEQGEASTEDLRQAIVNYRSLFAELLGATPAVTR